MLKDDKCFILKDDQYLEKNLKCLITGELLDKNELNNFNIIKLNCGHYFKYNIFIKSFNIMNKDINSYYKCPYCLSNINNVPIIIKKNT